MAKIMAAVAAAVKSQICRYGFFVSPIKSGSLVLMVLFLAFSLTAIDAEARGKCEAALNQADLARKVAKTFSNVITEQAPTLAITARDLRTGQYSEMRGQEHFAKTKLYLLNNGSTTWWFSESNGSLPFSKVRAAGRLDNKVEASRLKIQIGTRFTDVATNERYVFDDVNENYLRLSPEVAQEFKDYVASMTQNKTDPVKRNLITLFAAEYGDFLMARLQSGDLKPDQITDGQIIMVEHGARFFLYVPKKLTEPVYFFARTHDGHFMKVAERTQDPEDPKDIFSVSVGVKRSSHYEKIAETWMSRYWPSAMTLDEPTVLPKTFKVSIERNDVAKDNKWSLTLTILTESQMSGIRRALTDKDLAQDNYETGPYITFANKYLSDFINTLHLSKAEDIKALSEIQLLGEGYDLGNPTENSNPFKKFGAFKYNGNSYFYVEGQTQVFFGLYPFGDPNLPLNGSLADQVSVSESGHRHLDFTFFFPRKTLLPSGQQLTITDRHWQGTTLHYQYSLDPSGENIKEENIKDVLKALKKRRLAQ